MPDESPPVQRPTDVVEPRQPIAPATPDAWTSRVIGLLVAGVLAWGVFHAIGAYRFNHNPWRGVVVLGCVLGFLAFWGVLLRSRARRVNR